MNSSSNNNSSCWHRPDWGKDQVVRNSHDGLVRRPINMNPGLFVIHCLICPVGLVANIQTIFQIACSSGGSGSGNRGIFQLGTLISSIFILLEAILEMGYHLSPPPGGDGQYCDDWPSSQMSICLVHTFFSSIPYVLFFFNLLISLVDWFISRFIESIYHHLIPWLLIVSNLSLGLSLNWVFISGQLPIRCAIQPTHASTVDLTLLTLYSACVIVFLIHCIFQYHQIFNVMGAGKRRLHRITPSAAATTAAWDAGDDELAATAMNNGGGRRGGSFVSSSDWSIELIHVALLLILSLPWLLSQVLPLLLLLCDNNNAGSHLIACDEEKSLWMLVVGPYFEEVVIIVLAVAHPVLIHFSNSRQGVDVDNDVNSSELNKAQTPPLVPPPLSASSADTRF